MRCDNGVKVVCSHLPITPLSIPSPSFSSLPKLLPVNLPASTTMNFVTRLISCYILSLSFFSPLCQPARAIVSFFILTDSQSCIPPLFPPLFPAPPTFSKKKNASVCPERTLTFQFRSCHFAVRPGELPRLFCMSEWAR